MPIIFTSSKSEVELLKQKDRKTQRAVFDNFHKRMYALCNRYITDPYQAEDVLMAGFMLVFNRIDQYRNEGSFEGWIRQIMVTQALQYLRKNKSLEINRYDDVEDEAAGSVVEESVYQSLDYEQLIQLVQNLPMGYRMVFNLFAIEGYSHPEIAEMLGISEGSSKSQLFKARAMLQGWIARIEGEKRFNQL